MNTIFVSSSFRDMQHERDAIQHIVAPQVNAVARRYGQSVSFCDLRWGINTEGDERYTATRKIIDVCLDEIDRSNPPMVALLGYRYGWTPLVDGLSNDGQISADGAKAMQSASIRKGMILDDLEISVTELELRFGGLANDGKRMPILCYLREIDPKGDVPDFFYAEDDWHSKKLEELKQRIQALTHCEVRTYRVSMGECFEDDIRAFAGMLAKDLMGALSGEWEALSRLTPYERTLRTHEQLMHEKAGLMAVHEGLVRSYAYKLLLRPGTRIVLEGEGGVGKTTVAAAVAERIEKAGNTPLLFLSCGTTADTTTVNGVLRIETQFLSSVLERSGEQLRNQDVLEGSEDFRTIIEQLCVDLDMASKKVIVIIDAVDQLVDANDLETAGLLPNTQHDSLRMLLTTTRHYSATGTVSERLGELECNSDVLQVLESLERRHAHEVSDDAKQSIIAKSCSRKPLYISLVYQRLLMMSRLDFEQIRSMGGGIKARAKYEAEMVANCPDDIEGMIRELFDEAGSCINPQLIDIVVNGIAASRFGLRAEDFAAIGHASWSQVDFSHIIHYLSESFMLREDGRYDFSHKTYRQALSKSPGVWGEQMDLLDYLWGLPEDDPIRVSEVTYHCMRADNHERFSEYIKWCHTLQDRTLIDAAAECIYQQVHEDGGDWIGDFLNRRGSLFARLVWTMRDDDELSAQIKKPEPEVDPEDWRIVAFICFELYPLFGCDKQDAELLGELLEDCELFAHVTVDEYTEIDPVFFMTVVGLKRAQLILTSSGIGYSPTVSAWYSTTADEEERHEKCRRALRILDRSIHVLTILKDDIDTEPCWYMLAFMYLWRTRAFLAIGKSDESDAAIKDCIDIWERLSELNPNGDYRREFATALVEKARILLSNEQFEGAADYLMRALELMGNPNDLSGVDLMDYLAFTTTTVIALCGLGEETSLKTAEAIAIVELELAERLVIQVGGNAAKAKLRDALHVNGFVLQSSGEYPRIRESVPYYEKAIDIALGSYQASGSEDDRLNCLLIIDEAINILHYLGDSNSIARASELFKARSQVDKRTEGQLMLGGYDAAQRQSNAEKILSGYAPDTDLPTSIIEITLEDGEQMLAQIIDRFSYRSQDYAVMKDVKEDDGGAMVFVVTESGEYDLYEAVEDDETIEAVFELFKQRNEDFFNFID